MSGPEGTGAPGRIAARAAVRAGRASIVPIVLIAIGLAISVAATFAERRLVAREAARAASLRELRVVQQRTVQARIALERDGERVRTLEADLDATRLAILGAVESLAGSPDVNLLGHALGDAGRTHDDPATDLRVLRLSIELEAAHAVRLVDALGALASALPGRPVEVVGCRIDRAGPGRSSGTGESLVAGCALDWYWWPS